MVRCRVGKKRLLRTALVKDKGFVLGKGKGEEMLIKRRKDIEERLVRDWGNKGQGKRMTGKEKYRNEMQLLSAGNVGWNNVI